MMLPFKDNQRALQASGVSPGHVSVPRRGSAADRRWDMTGGTAFAYRWCGRPECTALQRGATGAGPWGEVAVSSTTATKSHK